MTLSTDNFEKSQLTKINMRILSLKTQDIDVKKAEAWLSDQHNIVEKELNNIKKVKNGKAGLGWTVRKKVTGEKKTKYPN